MQATTNDVKNSMSLLDFDHIKHSEQKVLIINKYWYSVVCFINYIQNLARLSRQTLDRWKDRRKKCRSILSWQVIIYNLVLSWFVMNTRVTDRCTMNYHSKWYLRIVFAWETLILTKSSINLLWYTWWKTSTLQLTK